MTDPEPPHNAPRPDSENTNIFKRELIALLPHMRAFARGLSGHAEAADDLVQDTVMKAWAARASYRPGTNLKAWAFTIMRNHFINQVRRNRKFVVTDPAETQDRLVEPSSQEDRIHLSDLQLALNRLPSERREALLLVGAGGFSYEEAAKISGVAIGTLKSRVSRGRMQLLQLLEGTPEE